MRERDRIAMRAHRDEIEAEERAERERIHAPIREAEAKLLDTHLKLTEVYRARLRGETKDPDLFVDPAVATARMTKADANAFNANEYRKYRSAHPETYWGEGSEVTDMLARYWTVNGIEIASESMFANVVGRMRDLAMLPEYPHSEPEPESQSEPEPIPAPQPEVFEGRDPDTGEPRTYTKREVYLMSAETYRRTFPTLGTMTEVLSALRERREQR